MLELGKILGAVSVVFPCFGEFVGRAGGRIRRKRRAVAACDELELDDRLGQRRS